MIATLIVTVIFLGALLMGIYVIAVLIVGIYSLLIAVREDLSWEELQSKETWKEAVRNLFTFHLNSVKNNRDILCNGILIVLTPLCWAVICIGIFACVFVNGQETVNAMAARLVPARWKRWLYKPIKC